MNSEQGVMHATATAEPGQSPLSDTDRDRIIQRVRRLAWLLDTCVRIPGTKLTVGLDPIVGLAPGIGDALMLAAGLYIVYEAKRLGATRPVLGRMMVNLLIDTLVGSVLVLGDLFDAGWKANQRNLKLMEIEVFRP